MAIYEIGLRTTGVAAAGAGLEIRANANRIARLHELEIVLAAATASTFGIGRPANSGSVAGGTTNAPPASDTDDVTAYGGALILSGWTTAPTAPTSFFRRVNLPATLGAAYLWVPKRNVNRPVEIPAGGSLVLWNLALNGVADVNLVLEDVGV
jgi:hypothetical protein